MSHPSPATERRAHPRTTSDRWQTAITAIQQNSILVRGYAVDELMGRVSFADAIYLLLMGELPTPAIGRMLNAVLLSTADHGVTPPSTLATRNVATSGAPLKDSVAAGLLAFGPHHGGDIGSCIQFLDAALALVHGGEAMQTAAARAVEDALRSGSTPPGFGHRLHTRDPRAARLFQLALELDLEGEHVRMLRAVERVLENRRDEVGALPVNVDGAIAAICADLGFGADLGNALFLISRLPGLIAHAHEERTRQRPMRQIDVSTHEYDGARERRVPETRRQ